MDRPRFQVDIGTIMVAVIAIAIPIGVARTFGPAMGLFLAFATIRPAIYMYVRGRCRADGRSMFDRDREKVDGLYIRACFLMFAMICVGLVLNLSPESTR